MDIMREENGVMSEKSNNLIKRERSRSPAHRSRSRSRSPRDWKRSERKDGERSRSSRSGGGDRNRTDRNKIVKLHIANIPYDLRWQQVKDLFRDKTGTDVVHVVLYDGQDGKPLGAGFLDVRGVDGANRIIEEMHRYEIDGRKIIVREAREKDIIRFENMPVSSGRTRSSRYSDEGPRGGNFGNTRGGFEESRGGYDGPRGGYDRGGLRDNDMMGPGGPSGPMNLDNIGGSGPTVGGGMPINYALLQRLGIEPDSLTNQVFVANLHYRVTERKLEEIFSMAGKVIRTEIKMDRDGKSRGFGTVTFEHPMEAAQAVSMFHNQSLYDREMAVKIDKLAEPPTPKLPSGLKGVGMGLGLGGMPIQNFSQVQANVGGSNGGVASLLGGSAMGNFGGNLSAGLSSQLAGGGLAGNTLGSGIAAGYSTGLGSALTGSALGGSMVQGSLATGLNQGLVSASYAGSNLLGGGISAGLMGSGGLGIGLNSHLGGSGSGLGGGASSGLSSLMGNDISLGSFRGVDTGRSYSGSNDPYGSSSLGATDLLSLGRSRDDGRGLMGRDDLRLSGSIEDESNTIVIRNLPFSMSWQDLKDKFIDCGDIKHAEIVQKGIGVIRFLYADDARRAVSLMNGARLGNRQISVRLEKFN